MLHILYYNSSYVYKYVYIDPNSAVFGTAYHHTIQYLYNIYMIFTVFIHYFYYILKDFYNVL